METSRFRRLHVGLLMLIAAALAASLMVLAWHLKLQREDMLHGAESQAANLARAIEEHAARSLVETSAALERIAAAARVSPSLIESARGGSPGALRAVLERESARVPQVRAMAMYDAGGRRLAAAPQGTWDAMPSEANGELLAHHLRAGSEALPIGTRSGERGGTSTPRFPMSLALRADDGSLLAFIVAQLDAEHFARFFTSISASAGSDLALLRADGTLLVAAPLEAGSAALAESSQVREAIARADTGLMHVELADGRELIVAHRAVRGQPLVVVLSLDQDEVLAPWRRDALEEGLLGLVVCALFGAIGSLLLRQLATLEQAAAALEAQQRSLMTVHREMHAARTRVEDAIEGLPDAFCLWDRDDRLQLYNRRYLDLYPYLRELPSLTGTPFATILRLALERNAIADPLAHADPETWMSHRLALHRNADGSPVEQHLADGRVIEIRESRTREGGIVSVRSLVREAPSRPRPVRVAAGGSFG